MICRDNKRPLKLTLSQVTLKMFFPKILVARKIADFKSKLHVIVIVREVTTPEIARSHFVRWLFVSQQKNKLKKSKFKAERVDLLLDTCTSSVTLKTPDVTKASWNSGPSATRKPVSEGHARTALLTLHATRYTLTHGGGATVLLIGRHRRPSGTAALLGLCAHTHKRRERCDDSHGTGRGFTIRL